MGTPPIHRLRDVAPHSLRGRESALQLGRWVTLSFLLLRLDRSNNGKNREKKKHAKGPRYWGVVHLHHVSPGFVFHVTPEFRHGIRPSTRQMSPTSVMVHTQACSWPGSGSSTCHDWGMVAIPPGFQMVILGMVYGKG